MREFFQDIFEYHHHFNQKLADLLIQHTAKISKRTIPLFSHNINAHLIWNARILNIEPKVGVHHTHSLEVQSTRRHQLSGYFENLETM